MNMKRGLLLVVLVAVVSLLSVGTPVPPVSAQEITIDDANNTLTVTGADAGTAIAIRGTVTNVSANNYPNAITAVLFREVAGDIALGDMTLSWWTGAPGWQPAGPQFKPTNYGGYQMELNIGGSGFPLPPGFVGAGTWIRGVATRDLGTVEAKVITYVPNDANQQYDLGETIISELGPTDTDIQIDLLGFNLETVYVDDGWAGCNVGDPALNIPTQEVDPGKFCKINAFDKVQDGINNVYGSTVNVAAGTYVETGQIVISKDLSIVGAGAPQTTIKPAADTGSSGDARGWFLVNSGVTFNLSGATLDGTGRNVHQGIRHKGAGTISDCVFANIKYPGYMGVGMAVMGPSGMNVDVTNCTFTEMGRVGVIYFGAGVTGTFSGNTYTGKGDGDWLDYAVEVGGGADATISNNTINGNTGVASSDGSTSAGILVTTYYGSGTQATITGNTISSCAEGIAVGYDAGDTSAVTAHSNNLAGNVTGISSTAPAVDAEDNWWGSADGPTHASNTFNVGSQGVAASNNVDFVPWLDAAPPAGNSFAPVTTTDPVGDHASIQAGVDFSNPGGTVNAADGIYTATSLTSIVITKDGLSLVGQSRDGTIIDAGPWGTSSAGWPRGIHVYANDVTIRDLTVQGFTGDGASTGGYGIVFRHWAHDTPGEGYIFYSGGLVDNVKLDNNYSSLYALVHRNLTVSNSHIQNSLGDGMFIARESDNATVTGNTVLNSADHGIWVGYCWSALGPSDNATITGNVVDGAREGGISFVASNGAVISGNDVSHVKGEEPEVAGGWSRGAISLKDGVSNVTVSDNVVHDNDGLGTGSGRGLGVDGTSSNITLTGNTIRDNAGGGIKVLGTTSGWTANSNSIYNNAGYGAQNVTGAVLNFTDNWWGSASGPTHASNTFNVGSQGDVVSDNVDFVPWLDAAPPAGNSFAPVTTTDPLGSHASIQAGINASNAGRTVNAAAGTYTETLNVSARNDISVVGEDRDTVILRPNSTLCWDVATYACARRAAVRVVGSTDIDFSSMTFDFDLVKGNNVAGVFYWDSTGVIDNNVLKNMTLPDASGGYYELTSYIRAPSYSDGARAAVTFSNNVFLETGRLGIVTHDFVNATIEDNTFTKTTDDFGYAIEMGSRSTGTISGNTISGYDTPALSDGSESAGVYIENAFTAGLPHVNKPVTVSGNTITGNQYGLWIGNEYDGYAGDIDIIVTLQGNTIQNNVDGGVYVVDEDRAAGSSVTLTASGNDVSNNGPVGYYFNTYGDGELHATLTGETIAGQATGILVEDNASGSSNSLYDLAVHGSSIGGSSYGINNTTPTLVNAEDNWWGSANGPTHASNTFNVGSQGVAVSDNVDFTPWLDGPPPGGDSFAPVTTTDPVGGHPSIQAGINASNPGGSVNAKAGTFTENVTVNKGVTVAGAGQAATLVIPAVSKPNPCAGSSLCGSANAASNIFLIQASNVTIRDLTADGDNPTLTSGIVRGGADLDARNGIIENYYPAVPYNNLHVHDVTVRNIYLRGIYASSYGTGFNFHHNTVQNVQGEYASICIFNFGGSGAISDNSVSDCNDAIAANWSKGTQFTGNTATNSGSGIHSDNNGGMGGVGDLIQGNVVTNSTAGGYGIWTFVPYVPITVQNNTISGVDVGLAASGQAVPVSTSFVNNQVTGKPGSTGVYVTTDQFGWGYGNVSATFTGNTITGHADGFLIEAQAGYTATVNATGNSIFGNSVSGATTTGAGTHSATMENNWWGSASGPRHPSNTFNVPAQGDAVVGNVDFVPWLNAAPPTGVSFAPVTTTSPVDSYASIQAGVNGSNPGGTVNAKAGTFDEQVVVGKSLTLQGAGATTVVKPSSAAKLATVLSGHWWGLTRQIAGIIVANVADGSSVTVKNLKVDGEGVATQPAGADYVAGAFYRETGGSIETVTVTNMTVGATGTAVRGYAAYLSAVANTASVEIKGSAFTNYDKNGIDAHGNKLSVNAHDNALTGRGPLPSGDEVQNGIVVMDGAVGAVNANTVSSHVYTPETWWAAAILFLDSGGSAWNNTLTNNQIGVMFQDGNGSASENAVSGGKLGLYAQGTKAGTWTASFTGNTVGGSDTAGIGGATYHSGASIAIAIGNNSLTGGPGGGVVIGDAPEYGPAGSVSATVTGNVITGWLRGVDLLSSAAGSTSINFNTISGNTQFGVRNLVPFTVDAENNSWGACDGPGPVGPGSGDAVSTLVDYDPWLHGGCDYDGDRLGDDQESLIGTDWQNPDTDGDGCDDGREYVSMPGFDPRPEFWHDFYDVPVPVNPDMTPNGPRNKAVNVQDVVGVTKYVGTSDNGPRNANGVDYDSDKNGDTVEDGRDYDRSPGALPNPPYEAGPPSGAVNIQDVVVVLKQVGLSCQ